MALHIYLPQTELQSATAERSTQDSLLRSASTPLKIHQACINWPVKPLMGHDVTVKAVELVKVIRAPSALVISSKYVNIVTSA